LLQLILLVSLRISFAGIVSALHGGAIPVLVFLLTDPPPYLLSTLSFFLYEGLGVGKERKGTERRA